jgi:hypothetical protein
MNKTSLEKILQHPDKDEIISKLIIGISPKTITEWLKGKYTNVDESKFVISEKTIKSFKDNYLDIYKILKEDFDKTKNALATNAEDQLMLSVQNNPTYKNKMIELASQEIDIKKMLANMIIAIETRAAQIFDSIQEDPRNINSRNDRVLREWFDTLGANLERFHKLVNGAPDQIIQHNITLQAVDQHISVFHDVIRDVLSKMDLESSMYFMELFNERMSKLKQPDTNNMSTEERLVEAKILNETITKKINETG